MTADSVRWQAWFVDDERLGISLPCARCGYDLFGLAISGRCPECGHGVAESLRDDDPSVLPADQARWIRGGLKALAVGGVLTGLWTVCVALTVVTLVIATALGVAAGSLGWPGLWIPLMLAFAAGLVLTAWGSARVSRARDFRYRSTLRRRLLLGALAALLLAVVTFLGHFAAQTFAPLAAAIFASALLPIIRYAAELCMRLRRQRWRWLATWARALVALGMSVWVAGVVLRIVVPRLVFWIRLPGGVMIHDVAAVGVGGTALFSAGVLCLAVCAAGLLSGLRSFEPEPHGIAHAAQLDP